MAVGDVYQMIIEGSLNGQRVLNTFGLVANSDEDTPTQFLAESVAAALPGSGWSQGRTTQYAVGSVACRDISPGTAPLGRAQCSSVGTEAEESAPGNCAVVVSWKTALRGRNNRGRMYLGGYSREHMTGGYWSAEVQDAASGAASFLFDSYGPLSGGVGTLVLISYVPNSSPRVLRAAEPITAFTIDNVIYSMRTRTVGHGT
jgi:hypothetical protein